MISELKILFDKNNGYLTKKELHNKAEYKSLQRLIAKGEVERVKRGVYHFCRSEVEPMVDIEKIVPNGVLCLFSTWLHYGLSTSIPHSFNIAVERSRKISLPEYPPIQLYFWKQEFYELGITTENIYGFNVKIYDLEKSVCDAVKFRNKVGMDVAIEVVRNYVRSRQYRNLDKLTKYARQMKIETIMQSIIMPML